MPGWELSLRRLGAVASNGSTGRGESVVASREGDQLQFASSFALIVSVGGKPDGGLAKRTGLSLGNVAGARMECQYYILLLQIITTTTTNYSNTK